MNKKDVKKAVIGLAAGITVAVAAGHVVPAAKIGRIQPVNLHQSSGHFSVIMADDDCCGPYAQKCDEYSSPAPDMYQAPDSSSAKIV